MEKENFPLRPHPKTDSWPMCHRAKESRGFPSHSFPLAPMAEVKRRSEPPRPAEEKEKRGAADTRSSLVADASPLVPEAFSMFSFLPFCGAPQKISILQPFEACCFFQQNKGFPTMYKAMFR